MGSQVSSCDVISFPIVVSGPSGVGKTTLCHGLMEGDPRLAFSISATTRQARASETDGTDYFFVSEQEFRKLRAEGGLAEWALVHGNLYGTPKEWLDDKLTEGISILLDIDVQGGVQILDAYPSSVSIFVVPPSFRVLEERLRNRKSDEEQAIRQRLENALGEMEYITRYSYVVVNDTIEQAVSSMRSIVHAERCSRERILGGITWREFVGLEGKGV
jgi:guanylate kinase